MKKTPTVIPEKIQILSVTVTNGSIKSNADSSEIGGFKTTFDTVHGINEDEKIMKFNFTVKLEGMNKLSQPIDISAEYTTEFIFKVDNLEEFLIKDNPEVLVVESVLVGTLVGMVYSTTRGIILTRTQGTPLEGILLPVVSVKKLMNNEIK